MKVSTEQIEAIERGETVQVTLDDTECVIIRKDLYEKLGLLEVRPEEAYPVILEAWDSSGSPEDSTDYL